MPSLSQIALGSNNTGGLQDFVVQPDYDGVQYPREIYAVTDVFDDGALFVELRFPSVQSASDWSATLAQCGLASAKTAQVTIRLLNLDKETRTTYNGQAVRPQVTSWDMCWYKTPTILVRRLEAL